MNTAEDTLDLTQVPFYQWDSIPYELEVETPEVGVATDSTFGVYMLRDTTAVRESVERPRSSPATNCRSTSRWPSAPPRRPRPGSSWCSWR